MIALNEASRIHWATILKDEPADSLAWLAFSDFLEEQGETAAAGVRLWTKSGLEPREWVARSLKATCERSHDWWVNPGYAIDLDYQHRLDKDIFDSLKNGALEDGEEAARPRYREYPSRFEAIMALAEVLAKSSEEER